MPLPAQDYRHTLTTLSLSVCLSRFYLFTVTSVQVPSYGSQCISWNDCKRLFIKQVFGPSQRSEPYRTLNTRGKLVVYPFYKQKTEATRVCRLRKGQVWGSLVQICAFFTQVGTAWPQALGEAPFSNNVNIPHCPTLSSTNNRSREWRVFIQ